MTEKIVSFEEYRKKKLGSNYKKDIFSEIFDKDLRDQPDLIAWYNFHNTLNRYRLFVTSLFTENNFKDKNPNSWFVIAFKQDQIVKAVAGVTKVVESFGNPIVVGANNISFISLCEQVTEQESYYPVNVSFADFVFLPTSSPCSRLSRPQSTMG